MTPGTGEARWLEAVPADLRGLWPEVPEGGTVALVCNPVGPQGEVGRRALPLDLIVAAAERLGALGAEVQIVCVPSDLEDYEALDQALDELELAGFEVVIDADPREVACGGAVIASAAVLDAVAEADHRALVVRAAPHHVLRFGGVRLGVVSALFPEAREHLLMGAATPERLDQALDELGEALDFGWALCDLRAFGRDAGLVAGRAPGAVDAVALERVISLGQDDARRALAPPPDRYPEVDDSLCTRCGACTQLCPTGAVALSEDGAELRLEHGRCVRCGICVATCPDFAMTQSAPPESVKLLSAGAMVLDVVPDPDSRETKVPIEAALALGPAAVEPPPRRPAWLDGWVAAPRRGRTCEPAWRPEPEDLVPIGAEPGAPDFEAALERANQLATERLIAGAPPRIPIVREELPFCNDNCLHCGVADILSSAASMATLDAIEASLRELAPRSGGRVMFAVSELTLRPDFLEILATARRVGMGTVALVTNGRRFAQPGFAARAVEAGLTHALVSIYGPTPRTHQALTRTAKSFEQTVKGVRELVRCAGDVALMTNTVITRKNYRHLPQLVELLAGLGVQHVNLSFVQIIGNAARYQHMLVPRMTDVLADLRAAIDLGRTLGLTVGVGGLPYCVMKGYERHFGGDDFSYVDTGDPAAAVVPPPALALRPDKCRRCAFVAVCAGPQQEYLDEHGDEELEPYPGSRLTRRPPSELIAAMFPELSG